MAIGVHRQVAASRNILPVFNTVQRGNIQPLFSRNGIAVIQVAVIHRDINIAFTADPAVVGKAIHQFQ